MIGKDKYKFRYNESRITEGKNKKIMKYSSQFLCT